MGPRIEPWGKTSKSGAHGYKADQSLVCYILLVK